jgi:hypothetical protein
MKSKRQIRSLARKGKNNKSKNNKNSKKHTKFTNKSRKHRRRVGGETDAEVRERRRREEQQKKMESQQKGTYLKPYDQKEGDIVNQNLDYGEMNNRYNDRMNFASAEMDDLTFGGSYKIL